MGYCSDLIVVLKLFMLAKKLLESQTCVTVSLFPYIIYKIWKGLQASTRNPASEYVQDISVRNELIKNS